ncbi:gamma-glutamylcyclotransferase [Actibacterium pelagium]|uniref:glutathione-specific gamma-glutamylcyclotransferase n=1 Tax=Actibacterium pelagium TaxID=2029103 RepID=A0A917EL89_9RHOB|nr:gamma-glutamylcyclotransferase [Actibacterium pelagium]GGE59376.1 gamma-glutamylcyclotransferase [Actibacterium pelagium]
MTPEPMWVFAYGSLMWNPGFPVAETHVARVEGYHRSFCMWSIHHRGTTESPGLVLALDEGSGVNCLGLGLRVEPGAEEESLALLRERELVSSAYLEKEIDLILQPGEVVRAVTYVIDPNHEQYCRHLSLEDQAQTIARAVGGRGPNTEYLYNTVDHLRETGIEDPELNWLSQRVREITTGSDA